MYTRERVRWEGEEQIDTLENNRQLTALCILLIGAAHAPEYRYAHAVGGFMAELKNVSIDGKELEGKVTVGTALVHRLGCAFTGSGV